MFIIQPLKLVLESYKWRVLNNNVHYLILFRVFMVLLFILSFLLFELLDKCLLQLIKINLHMYVKYLNHFCSHH